MATTSIAPASHKRLALFWMLPALAMLAIAGWIGWHALQPTLSAAPPAKTVSVQEFEATWGIRITLIGVTADGGLIDLRYQVIDAQKAATIAKDKATVPTLIDEQTGIAADSSVMSHTKHVMVAGQTYFQLYRNRQGAIQHGHPITVKIGDVQIEHLIAQ